MYDETITNRINALQPPYREFVLSDMPKIITEEFGELYSLDDARLGALGNAIILLLTFLLDRKQFVEFAQHECALSFTEADALSWGIITSLPEDIRELYLTTDATLNASAASPFDLSSEIHQTETILEAIPSVRTMQSTPAETVYTSTQAAILHEGTTPDSPAATNTGPRWDSAQ